MINDYETTAFAVAEELNRAAIHKPKPRIYRAALVGALQKHAIEPSKLQSSEVHIGGDWFVVCNRLGEWREERRPAHQRALHRTDP